ncbi:MAG: GMC family oxidoreductase N-terminal domain-containing protein [Thiolinea sp.]
MKKTDILIIGAGSAGCTLAARLSEDPDLTVTLVEAGGTSRYPWIDIPIGYFKTVGNKRFDWGFVSEPESSMAGRQLPWPRGKGLGGSSLINGMLYLRGHKADYDQWAALGLPGWDWNSVLPYFKKSQSRAGASGATIGKDGP